jgi:hypothetical protein
MLLSFFLFLVEPAMILINGSVYEIENDKSRLLLWSSVPTVLLVLVSVNYHYRVFLIRIQSGQSGGQKMTHKNRIPVSSEIYFMF